MDMTHFRLVLAAAALAALTGLWLFAYASSDHQPRVRAWLTAGLHRPRPGRHADDAVWEPFYALLAASPPGAPVPAAVVDAEPVADLSERLHVWPAGNPSAARLVGVPPVDAEWSEVEPAALVVDPVVLPPGGATEDWSPFGTVGIQSDFVTERLDVAVTEVTLHRTEPDAEERALLERLDAFGATLHAVPEWMLDWQKRVDAGLAALDIDSEPHRRWRAGAFDFPTGEYRMPLLVRSP